MRYTGGHRTSNFVIFGGLNLKSVNFGGRRKISSNEHPCPSLFRLFSYHSFEDIKATNSEKDIFRKESLIYKQNSRHSVFSDL